MWIPVVVYIMEGGVLEEATVNAAGITGSSCWSGGGSGGYDNEGTTISPMANIIQLWTLFSKDAACWAACTQEE